MKLKKSTFAEMNGIWVMVLLLMLSADCRSQTPRCNYGFMAVMTSADQGHSYNPLYFDYPLLRRTGTGVGAFVEWPELPYLSLMVQMEYVPKGMGNTIRIYYGGPIADQLVEAYGRLDYVSIPIIAKFIWHRSSISPYLLAGARVDILAGYDSDGNVFDYYYRRLRSFDFGGSLGVGLEVEVQPSTSLLFELRYNPDFTYSYDVDPIQMRNNAFDFRIGVKL